MNALRPDAMTFHWEFTLGSERVNEIVEGLPFAALGQKFLTANGMSRPICSRPISSLKPVG